MEKKETPAAGQAAEKVEMTTEQIREEKAEPRTMGSMKNSAARDSAVKDFYTREEALRFSRKDFDKNPALFRAVEASMLKW